MTTFFISIIHRNGDTPMEGPYKTKDKAIAALKKYVAKHYPAEAVAYSESRLGGKLNKGTFYT